jgi:hypothetical protein
MHCRCADEERVSLPIATEGRGRNRVRGFPGRGPHRNLYGKIPALGDLLMQHEPTRFCFRNVICFKWLLIFILLGSNAFAQQIIIETLPGNAEGLALADPLRKCLKTELSKATTKQEAQKIAADGCQEIGQTVLQKIIESHGRLAENDLKNQGALMLVHLVRTLELLEVSARFEPPKRR